MSPILPTSPLKGKKVTVIGAGVIGCSWVSLFLAAGMKVTVADPAPDLEKTKRNVIEAIKLVTESLRDLGYDPENLTAKAVEKNLSFETKTEKAVSQADYIQENAPECQELKVALWAKVEQSASEEALFFSSSSGIPASAQSIKMKNPGRLIIGHPFNPPALMPLVEIVPNPKTPEELTEKAISFYKELGKKPIRLHKEIAGFVINRLQSAFFRECVALVNGGVLNADEMDEAITGSIGLRWAVNGPFLSYYLAGGAGGFSHFLEMLGTGMEHAWLEQQKENVQLDPEGTCKTLSTQIEKAYGNIPRSDLESKRDTAEINIINLLKKIKPLFNSK